MITITRLAQYSPTTTVLTIAHRLHTVAFYDKILVLGDGTVKEYDTPLKLLQDPDSAFHSLADESGDMEALMKAAREAVGEAEGPR